MIGPGDVLALLDGYVESARGLAMSDAYYAQELPKLEAARAGVADLVEAKQRLDGLRTMCGHVQDGSCQFVSIGQDDATRTWIVSANKQMAGYGNTFAAAIDDAITNIGEGA